MGLVYKLLEANVIIIVYLLLSLILLKLSENFKDYIAIVYVQIYQTLEFILQMYFFIPLGGKIYYYFDFHGLILKTV